MMKRIFAWALILVIACMPMAASAADDHQEIIGGILAHLSGGQDIQEWIESGLCENAGGSGDNLLPALLHMNGGYNFSNYAHALLKKLDAGIKSVTTRQRSALMLSVLGNHAYISDDFTDQTIGEMGVMSYVFGLHLLNNGFKSNLWTTESLLEILESLQLEDGGWAVSGTKGDPDVTAMCLQAIAVCDDGSGKSRNMIDLALSYLTNAQNEDGTYSSYGAAACESCAQVIIALLSLGIDPLTDARFIKNKHTILDAMLAFRLGDGSFSHTLGGNTNTMACIQALSALINLQNPELKFYDFSNVNIAALRRTLSLPLWKLIAFGCIALFALIATIISLTKKRAILKRILFILIVCSIAAIGVWMLNFESASSYYSEIKTDQPVAGQVWLSIDCRNAAGFADDGSTPDNGEILPRTQMDFYEGDSVFDVLTYAARKFGLHIEFDGASSGLAYVNGINYLYEYAYGDLSGWIYLVNGEKQSVGCAGYTLEDGDEISWQYTLNLGEDVK